MLTYFIRYVSRHGSSRYVEQASEFLACREERARYVEQQFNRSKVIGVGINVRDKIIIDVAYRIPTVLPKRSPRTRHEVTIAVRAAPGNIDLEITLFI